MGRTKAFGRDNSNCISSLAALPALLSLSSQAPRGGDDDHRKLCRDGRDGSLRTEDNRALSDDGDDRDRHPLAHLAAYPSALDPLDLENSVLSHRRNH